jgi:HEAT repeat protein
MSPEKGSVKSQYASLALSMFSGFDKDVRAYYLDKLVEGGMDKDVRSAMAMAAGLGGMVSAQPKLLKLATDIGGDAKMRAYAALAYGMVGSGQSVETARTLREIYANSEDAHVRRGTLLGLGFVGDRAQVPFLCDVIANTKDDGLLRYTRGAAVIALGMIRDGESVTKIQEQLTGKADPRTRAYALAALGYLGDKDDVPALSTLFESANFRQEFGTLKVVMRQL